LNAKILMTSSSIVLAMAGVAGLFVPDVVLTAFNTKVTTELSMLVQLLGALYFGFALMNWTAKDSAIGGIYARPVSLGNFGHFFAGSMLLIRYQLSAAFNPIMTALLVIYLILAGLFYWLVFRATGLPNKA